MRLAPLEDVRHSGGEKSPRRAFQLLLPRRPVLLSCGFRVPFPNRTRCVFTLPLLEIRIRELTSLGGLIREGRALELLEIGLRLLELRLLRGVEVLLPELLRETRSFVLDLFAVLRG